MLEKANNGIDCDAGFVEALVKIQSTLAVTTVPGGLFLIGVEPDQVNPYFDLFPLNAAWGLAALNQRLAVATFREVVVFSDSPKLAPAHPDRPGYYDAFYTPRMTFFTGECSIHDLSITRRGLLGVNTRFSNVCLIDGQYSFDPVWQPPFISSLTPDDRCHLNGVATDEHRVLYATAFGSFDEPQGWRAHEPSSGILIDAATNDVLCRGLCLPHSPRLVDRRLFVLESGKGRVLTIDRQSGQADLVAELPGFVRGLADRGRILFVGLSNVRHTERGSSLPIAQNPSLVTGVAAIDAITGRVLGTMRFSGEPREVFALAVIPSVRRAGISNGVQANQYYAVDGRVVSYWLRVGAGDLHREHREMRN
ncbi:MAG TPA: TIGR03032 family protein [Roseiarcus sp.]|jgi:uncharacterized protein (TIGR03032 family)